VFNIQKAVSRLAYASKLKEIKVTDIKKGIGVFVPKPDKPVSFAALKETLKKAGYTLAAADVTATGSLEREDQKWSLRVNASGQRFVIEGPSADQLLNTFAVGSNIEVTGAWKTIGEGPGSHEVITLRTARAGSTSVDTRRAGRFPQFDQATPVRFIEANFTGDAGPPKPPAPIRVTSPGLTVYKGGAVTPRLYFITQHLGSLEVNRQLLDLSVSYTPSPRVQLEMELPVSHTSFNDGVSSGSGAGLGNVTLWAKYRFFRKVKTYGDRQAAARFGFELPTGKKDGPTLAQLNASAFVRQQLTPNNGGLSSHLDLAFSQAGGRFIFGGNAEGIFRSERDGFRMGHEIRLNTDTEYVLLPRRYTAPGGELFVILETMFVQRGVGHLLSRPVSGSNSTEFYLAPGLQYAAAPQFVIEGSFQFPLIRNTGPLVLRTDRNLLLGVRYLF
jgi:hypothetical protein